MLSSCFSYMRLLKANIPKNLFNMTFLFIQQPAKLTAIQTKQSKRVCWILKALYGPYTMYKTPPFFCVTPSLGRVSPASCTKIPENFILMSWAPVKKNGSKRRQEQETRSLSPLLLMQPETSRPQTTQNTSTGKTLLKVSCLVFCLRLGTTSITVKFRSLWIQIPSIFLYWDLYMESENINCSV